MSNENTREEYYNRVIYTIVFGVFFLVMGSAGLLAAVSPELFFPGMGG